MALAGIYAAMLVAFLALDALMLTFVTYPLFSRHVGELFRAEMRMGVAAGFYLLYVAGVLYLTVLPGLREASLQQTVLNAAVIGFLSYGTYELTNMATLKGWVWPMVLTDLIWGTVLTAVTAGIGYTVGRWLM